MLPLASMVNLVYMDCLVEWFGHLGIPYICVIPYLLMVDVVHPLLNNVLLTLYLVFLFYFHFLGLDEWFFCIKSCWFIVDIVHSLLPDLSLTFPPVLIWCYTYHNICIGSRFLLTPPPNFSSIACVDVDDLVPMRPEISLWIQFWNIFLLPYF